MKKERIIKIISFLSALCLIFVCLNSFLCVNDRRARIFIRGFYKEPKNSIDVILIGPSELYSDFNSPLAWQEYGFTSYSLSVPAMTENLYKPALETALSRQKPKLVVFEIAGFLPKKNEAVLRKWIDNSPWNAQKLKTIKELAPKENRYSYYFPFFKYHMNLLKNPEIVSESLSDALKLWNKPYYKTKSFSSIAKQDKTKKLKKRSYTVSSENKANLEKLLKYCKSEGLQNVLFIYSPHKSVFTTLESFDYLEKTVNSYGYDFINLNSSYEEIGLDVTCDFYNREHLNIFGSQKYTKYLGKLFSERYDVISKHDESVIAEWNDSAEYMNRVIKYLEGETLKNTGELFFETTEIKDEPSKKR